VAAAGTLACLLEGVAGEDAEGDRAGVGERELHQAVPDRAREDVEVRRLAADEAADRDDRVEPAAVREQRHRRRELEGAGHPEALDGHAGVLRRPLGPGREDVGDLAVPARDHDRHPGLRCGGCRRTGLHEVRRFVRPGSRPTSAGVTG